MGLKHYFMIFTLKNSLVIYKQKIKVHEIRWKFKGVLKIKNLFFFIITEKSKQLPYDVFKSFIL